MNNLEKVIDELKKEEICVLDNGFVRLVDVMGCDADICNAARVSYGDGTKSVNDDRNLIRYLMRHKHTSPFEMAELKFHVRVPMDCWRQWIRHRTANVNEYSTRYSIAINDKAKTHPHQWRAQATNNKQGSAGVINSAIGKQLSYDEDQLHIAADNVYNRRIELGVAREQARKDLPLSTYTEAYWKIDLHNLLHFLKLRLDEHAQLEIRSYALVIADIVKQIFPLTWEAFEDYTLNAVTFSGLELDVLKSIMQGQLTALKTMEGLGWLAKNKNGDLKNNRERDEFFAKLRKLDWDAILQRKYDFLI